MHDDLPDVPALRAQEPPPGGLAALRERLDAPPRHARWWWLTVPALAIAVAIGFVVLRRAPVAPPTLAKRLVPDREVATTFYWAASTPKPPRPDAPALPTVAPAVSIADAPRVNFGLP